MATMIPSSISPDCKSDAEKKIFRWFKSAPEEWYVLHSLNIIAKGVNMYDRDSIIDHCLSTDH